jgi:hypothetical protein
VLIGVVAVGMPAAPLRFTVAFLHVVAFALDVLVRLLTAENVEAAVCQGVKRAALIRTVEVGVPVAVDVAGLSGPVYLYLAKALTVGVMPTTYPVMANAAQFISSTDGCSWYILRRVRCPSQSGHINAHTGLRCVVRLS